MINWNELKNNQCPVCIEELSHEGLMILCSNDECDFSISRKKFDSLINKIYEPNHRRSTNEEEDNLSALNNL